MKISRNLSIALSSALGLLAMGCDRGGAEPQDHRAGVQLMSTSVDLSTHDLCWQADGEMTRIELDAAMLDSVATGYLDIPVSADVRAWLVAPGAACGEDSTGEVELGGLEFVDSTFSIVAVDANETGGFTGAFADVVDGDEENISHRGGDCSIGDYSVTTTTETGSGGSCRTRTVLRECQQYIHPMHGGLPWGNVMATTYDSGWIDCSDPCMAEFTAA
ncbi:MAG: hypothetical protein AAGA54_24890 [Myxococcota bacterium]